MNFLQRNVYLVGPVNGFQSLIKEFQKMLYMQNKIMIIMS